MPVLYNYIELQSINCQQMFVKKIKKIHSCEHQHQLIHLEVPLKILYHYSGNLDVFFRRVSPSFITSGKLFSEYIAHLTSGLIDQQETLLCNECQR